ncbi:MAG: hypothetical protein CSB28_00335 [Desulfobacterales bacterium]|nr:MAG: hypothetical protein CSB28_00335 [Desulfobacterales bacterium]
MGKEALIHHQNATCGVGWASIPLRRIQIRLRVLLPCSLASGILLVARKLVRGNENQIVIKLGDGFGEDI